MYSLQALQNFVLLFILSAAAVSDFRQHTVPNRLILAGTAASLFLTAVYEPATLFLSLAAPVCLILCLIPLHVLRMAGGADIKLAAFILLCALPERGGRILLISIFIAGFASAFKLLSGGISGQRFRYFAGYLRRAGRAGADGEKAEGETGVRAPYYESKRDGYGMTIPLACCFFLGALGELLRCTGGIIGKP